MLQKLQNLDYQEKSIILRVDYNVPKDPEGVIHDWQSWRIKATIPTLNKLIQSGARIILLAHSGRPKGEKDLEYSLCDEAEKLAQLLKRDFKEITPTKPPEKLQKLNKLVDPCYYLPQTKAREGETDHIPTDLKPGDILFLENVRFDSRERENSSEFASELAQIGDIYLSDAFAAAHREHTSSHALAQKMPHGAGLLLEKEYKTLKRIREDPSQPLYLVLGGAKVATKAKLIKAFLPKTEKILLGGVVANAVLAAQGVKTGASKLVEKKQIEKLQSTLPLESSKIEVPVDFAVAPSPRKPEKKKIISRKEISSEGMILDIGPETINKYQSLLSGAEEIIWNGNLGYSEVQAFAQGSKEIGRAINESKAFSVVGGGDTVAFLKKNEYDGKVSFCSTGGGAMLKFLAGRKLPGIEVLRTKSKK